MQTLLRLKYWAFVAQVSINGKKIPPSPFILETETNGFSEEEARYRIKEYLRRGDVKVDSEYLIIDIKISLPARSDKGAYNNYENRRLRYAEPPEGITWIGTYPFKEKADG